MQIRDERRCCNVSYLVLTLRSFKFNADLAGRQLRIKFDTENEKICPETREIKSF